MRSLVLLPLLVFFLLLTSAEAAKKKKKKPILLTRELLNLCKGQAQISRAQEKPLKWLVQASGEASITLKSSAQHQAACWILYKDRKVKGRSEHLFLQRYAVAVLHFATTKSNTTAWDWPMAVDEPKMIDQHGQWLHPNLHECAWYGVKCHAYSRIMYELDLGYLKLDGLIPREVGLLTGLRDLDFHANDFQGVVPLRLINNLKELRYLRLHMNGFFGALQKELTNLKHLKELYLFGNYFGGTIPPQLSELKELTTIDFYGTLLLFVV